MSDAGKIVMGSILMDANRVMPIALTMGITADWFGTPTEVATWEALDALWQAKSPIDPALAAEEMQRRKTLKGVGGRNVLEEMVDMTPTSTHAEYYMQLLRGEMLQSQMQSLWSQAREVMHEDPQHAVDTLADKLRELSERGMTNIEEDKRKLLGNKMELWTEVARQRFELNNPQFCLGVPLPWGCLNSVFNGLRPGLHIIGARPSVGKTMAALNISQFWCERMIPHAFVTLDMADDELLSRYVSAQAKISLRKLEWGARKNELEAARKQIDAIENSCMHMTHEGNVNRLAGWVRMAQRRWGIKALVIDYVQLCRTDGDRRMRMHERVCEATQTLKALMNELKMPCVLLAQLSRETEKAERDNIYAVPRLSDLGDSSELEKAAASVTMMYRDKLTEQYWRKNPPVGLAYGDIHLANNLRAVWFAVEKNQQGLAGVRRPFVMYPNYFILRPGAYETRQPIQETMEDPYSGKEKKVVTWRNAFACIRDDWRELSEDEELEAMGCLGERVCGENE